MRMRETLRILGALGGRAAGTAGGSPCRQISGENSHYLYIKAGDLVLAVGSGPWQRAVIHPPDARFGHGQNFGADARLAGHGLRHADGIDVPASGIAFGKTKTTEESPA